MRQLIKSESVRDRLDMPKSTFERLVKLRTHGFPSPIFIARSRFFDVAEIEAWMAELARRTNNAA